MGCCDVEKGDEDVRDMDWADDWAEEGTVVKEYGGARTMKSPEDGSSALNTCLI